MYFSIEPATAAAAAAAARCSSRSMPMILGMHATGSHQKNMKTERAWDPYFPWLPWVHVPKHSPVAGCLATLMAHSRFQLSWKSELHDTSDCSHIHYLQLSFILSSVEKLHNFPVFYDPMSDGASGLIRSWHAQYQAVFICGELMADNYQETFHV